MTLPFTHTTMSTTATTLFTRTTLLVALASTLTLSACGGGGGSSDPALDRPVLTAPTSATSSLTQGRWVSTGLTPAYTAIMVPAPTGANTPAVDTVWALAQDATTLIKLKANGAVQTAGAVTGNVYTLATSSVTAVSSANYTIQATASTPQMSVQPVLGTTIVFNRTDVMSTALRVDQANGRWQADLGAAKVNWTVQAANASTAATIVTTNLSGTSTTGCTYSGQSTAVATQSLYKVQFIETCSQIGSVTQTFNGVATLSPDDARLTVAATNEADTRAIALIFNKQP